MEDYSGAAGKSSSGEKVKHKSGTPYSSPYKKDMYDNMTFEKKVVTKPAKGEGMQGAATTPTQDASAKAPVKHGEGSKDYGKGNPYKKPIRSIQQLREIVKHKLA